MDKVSVLKWLCEAGGLKSLQQQCQRYCSELQVPALFTFHLLIDIMELLEQNVELGELLLHQPIVAWPLFQQLCYTALVTLEWLPELKSPSQLLLLIQLKSLPNLPGYIVEYICDLPSPLNEPRFYQITGTIASISVPEKFTECAVFSCPVEGCSGGSASENRYISVHVAGANEAATIGGDWSCYTCGSQLVEDVSHRMLADKLYLVLIPCGSPEVTPSIPAESWRLQGVCVVVRRELCRNLKLGTKITVIGVPSHRLAAQSQMTFIDTIIEANNIHVETNPVPATIPGSIAEILEACKYSPWVFLATLAFGFAADVCPPGCYHLLKMSLLLSLASLGTSESGSRNQGGSLLLAHGGVCIIENLSSHKKDVRETLQKALETDQVMMNVPKHVGLPETQEFSWKLNCVIWAHVDQQDKKKSFAKADSEVLREHSLQDTSIISKSLADHFGLVVVNDPTDIATQDHLHDTMMDHVMNNARNCCADPVLSYADLHLYLRNVSQLEVELCEDASELLKAFYVASRRVRLSSSHGIDVPIRALNTMNAIACAHAKLNLRNKAVMEDAVMSVFLYEMSLTSRFGYSVLGLPPCPHFKPNTDATMYIGKEFDCYMKQLYRQIIEFCKYQGICNIHQHEE